MTPFTQGELTTAQAAQLNQLMRTAEQFNRLTVAAPLNLSRAAGIPVISLSSSATDGEVIFAKVVSSSGTPAVHVCKQETRNASNAIVDVSPEVDFSQVLSMDGSTFANGTPVAIFPDPFFTNWWWAVPATASSSSVASGQSILGADFTMSATGSYENTGLTVSLPSAATYFLFAQVTAFGETVAGNFNLGIWARLFDVTASAEVTGSPTICIYQGWTSGSFGSTYGTGAIGVIYTSAGAATIRLEAKVNSASGWAATGIESASGSAAGAGTHIGYLKLS